jgi:hypothetical protein
MPALHVQSPEFKPQYYPQKLINYYYFFLAVLGLELRGFTLSHSTSPIFVKGFSR